MDKEVRQLEAIYRQAAVGKRRMQKTKEERNSEKRRLIQLFISLVLFLIVFLSRDAFTKQNSAWGEVLGRDADFAAAFQKFSQDIAADEPVLEALRRLAAVAFGGTVQQADLPTEPDADVNEVPEPLNIVLLSETEQHGLTYLRENGLRKYEAEEIKDPKEDTSIETTEPVPEPQIVTAVAQAYNSAGEALPKNVSYEHYELGLKETTVPVMGAVTSGFEYRTSPITGKREFHLALDIAADKGTEIAAFADGVVRYIGESDDFGLYLMIDHDNGVATFYAHCSQLLVRKGDAVTCGETVALVGDTGNATGYHLHFTIEKDNIRLNPAYYVDPS